MAAKFIKSVANFNDCPKPDYREVSIVGRSNAGKSSLINAWLGGAYAKVSQTPGKTELLNFFLVDSEFMLVDMPGYGYAKKGREKRESWVPLVEDYLSRGTALKGVILVVDGQRPWTEDEDNLIEYLHHHGRPVILCVNKTDRMNQKETSAKQRELAKVKPVVSAIIWTSARNKTGIEELRRSVFSNFLQASAGS
jgi:GTP-binding protein